MFYITSYSYERPKKTSTLLGFFIFYILGYNFLECIISEHSPDLDALCSLNSYYKRRNSKHFSFDQKWRLQ